MILKKICSYHGNALSSINTKRVLHNYTSKSSYILNLTLIAWMMWKLLDPQDFGKIVVTMATLFLKNTKNTSCTSIPQYHHLTQVSLKLLWNCRRSLRRNIFAPHRLSSVSLSFFSIHCSFPLCRLHTSLPY